MAHAWGIHRKGRLGRLADLASMPDQNSCKWKKRKHVSWRSGNVIDQYRHVSLVVELHKHDIGQDCQEVFGDAAVRSPVRGGEHKATARLTRSFVRTYLLSLMVIHCPHNSEAG